MKHLIAASLLVILVCSCNRNPQGFMTSKGSNVATQGTMANAAMAGSNTASRLAFITSYQENSVAVLGYTVRKNPNIQNQIPNQMMLDSYKMMDNSMVTITGNRLASLDFKVGKNPVDITISPDKKLIVVANSGDNTLTVVQAAPFAENFANRAVVPGGQLQINSTSVETAGMPSKIVFSSDSKYLLCANKTSRSISVFSNSGEGLKLIKTLDIQISPNDIDIFKTANLVIVSSFTDMGFVVLNYADLINPSITPKPKYVEMYGQTSSISVCNTSNNILAANINTIGVFPDGLESLLRNSSQLPIPSDGKNSDVALSLNGEIAVAVNETMNIAKVIRFYQQLPVAKGALDRNIANLNFNVIAQVKTGMAPSKVYVDPDGAYAISVNTGSNNLSFIGINYTTAQSVGDYMVKYLPSSIAVY